MIRPIATLMLSIAAIAPGVSASAQVTDTIPYANTIRVYPSDPKEVVIAKAAHVVPTKKSA